MAEKVKKEVEEKKLDEEVKPIIADDEDQAAKPPDGYTEEEWLGLSDAEKEGILDKDEEEEEEGIDLETLEAIAGEEESEVPEKKADEKKPEEKKVEEKPIGEVAKPLEEVAKPPEEVQKEKKPEEAPTVLSDDELIRFRATVSESELPVVDSIPAEMQKKLDDLDVKYDAGEIDLKTYNKDRDTINRTVTQQNISQRSTLRDQKIWEKEQTYFLRNRPEYVEKSMKGNALFGALGEAVKTLSNDPKYMGATGVELLIAADREIKNLLGLSPKVPESKKSESKSREKEVVKPPTPKPDVKTLADAPNADANRVDSPWNALDSLHGEAYETALEKLTPEQRARYEEDADRRSGAGLR